MVWNVTVWSHACFRIHTRIRIKFLIKNVVFKAPASFSRIPKRVNALIVYIVLDAWLAGHMKNVFLGMLTAPSI